jgi:hypothetical protein
VPYNESIVIKLKSLDILSALKIIASKSPQFLRDLIGFLKSGKAEFPYRGVGKCKLVCFRANFPEDRMPTHLPIKLHHAINKFMVSSHNSLDRSKCLFVTGDMKQAGLYGSVYAIFPVGKFRVAYSTTYRDALELYIAGQTTGEIDIKKLAKQYVDSIIETDNLKEAILSNNEILLSGNSYIAISYDYMTSNGELLTSIINKNCGE